MPRLTPLLPDQMDETQKVIYDRVMAQPRFRDLPKDSPTPGPFNAWIRSVPFMRVYAPYGRYLREEGLLAPRLAELAIITVGRIWSSEYEFASHAPTAVESGIDPEVVDAIRNRRRPQFVESDEEAVFNFANDLTANYRVSATVYEAAVEALGEAGVVELIGLLGVYVTTCMTINAFQIPLREDMAKQFADI